MISLSLFKNWLQNKVYKGLSHSHSLSHSLSIHTHTHTHTTSKEQASEGEVSESKGIPDRICPLLEMLNQNPDEIEDCLGCRCAWFDFQNDACAILAIAKMLNSFEEWERDRS